MPFIDSGDKEESFGLHSGPTPFIESEHNPQSFGLPAADVMPLIEVEDEDAVESFSLIFHSSPISDTHDLIEDKDDSFLLIAETFGVEGNFEIKNTLDDFLTTKLKKIIFLCQDSKEKQQKNEEVHKETVRDSVDEHQEVKSAESDLTSATNNRSMVISLRI